MLYREFGDLESFIRIDTLEELKTKNYYLKEGDEIFVMENLTFYRLVQIGTGVNATLEEVEINAELKGKKIVTLGDDTHTKELLKELEKALKAEIETKEPNITKNTGFNLPKSDSDTLDDSNTLATSKVVKSIKDFYNDLKVRIDAMSFKFADILEKPNFISSIDNESETDFATPKGVKTSYDKAVSVESDLNSFKTKTTNDFTKVNNDIASIEWSTIRNKPEFVDSTTNESSINFATPKAVKDLHDLVDTKEPIIDKKTGFNLDKTNELNDESENKLATAKAVKSLKDNITTLENLKEPKITRSSSTSSESETDVATSKAVKTAYDLANSKQAPATTLAGYGITDFVVKQITEEDLNNIKTPGFYDQHSDANSILERHYPEQQAGSLLVSKSAYGVIQEYTTYANNTKYVRGMRDDDQFGNWTRINYPVSDSLYLNSNTAVATSKTIQDLRNGIYNNQQIGGAYSGNGGKQPPNYVDRGRVRFLMSNEDINGNYGYKDWIYMDTYGGGDVNWATAIGVYKSGTFGASIMRSNEGRTSWTEKAELWGTHNFSPNGKLDKWTEGSFIGFGDGSHGFAIGGGNEFCFTSSSGDLWFNYRRLANTQVRRFFFGNGSNGGRAGIVTADIESNGTISAPKVLGAWYNDYAERFPKKPEVETEPGDIIALDENSKEECYVPATKFHSTIVGVHTDEAAMIIGGEKEDFDSDGKLLHEEKYIPISLAGRVRVKFKGKAEKGMKVVPSSTPGVGRKFRPGHDHVDSIIGFVVENNYDEEIKRVRIKLK